MQEACRSPVSRLTVECERLGTVDSRGVVAHSAPVLVVDDDPRIREVVCFALRREGFETLEAGDGEEALRVFREHRPSLVVLDILMPEMDGTEVCRKIRADSRVPIVFLSSKDDEVDRILGLELGGDDYVTKPFSPRELIARVRAVLRRIRAGSPQGDPAESAGRTGHGKLVLDLVRHEALWDGRTVVLTVTEFGLLEALLRHPGKVYTREELMEKGYPDPSVVSGRTIDSHIRRIRHKFASVGGDPIETMHGVGYRLGPCR